MRPEEEIKDLIEDIHFGLLMDEKTKIKRDCILDTHSDAMQRQFRLGRITGLLECLSQDEKEQEHINTKLKEDAFERLPKRFKEDPIRSHWLPRHF